MFDPTLVHEYLRLSAERFPDKVALICEEERWTYRTLNRHSQLIARVLIDLGLKRHDRVVIFLDNSLESIASMYGVMEAGGTFIILNSTIKANKLNYVIKDSGAKILIVGTNKSRVVSNALNDVDSTCQIIWIGDTSRIPESPSKYSQSWSSILQNLEVSIEKSHKVNDFLNPRGIIDKDLAALIYTSGSTGDPKGVMSTHHSMISAARSIIQYLENTPDDIIINVLPLSFDYGLYQVIMAVMFGGTVVLEKSFLYPIRILERIKKEKITGFPIVPTIVGFLLKMQSLTKYDLSSLRYITNTGAALPEEHIKKLRLLLPQAKIYSMFGLTECKRVSYLPPDEIDRKPLSVGKAIPNCEVFIVDEMANEVGPGEIGELVIRGSNVMSGYWNAPELTGNVFRNGNYPGERVLYSGDYFQKDEEGYLYFLGRKDDLIKTKGERVGPKEVEGVICQIEGIIEAAVIGVPDEILGQAIKAFVVSYPSINISEKDVLKHCANNLEIFMVPKYVEFVKELPKTPNGKIDKKTLKDSFNKV